MTLIPNLLATGIPAVAAALAVSVVRRLRRTRRGGTVLIALSILLLVVGGGFGPPLLGVILGIATVRRREAPRRTPGRVGQTFGQWWPWFAATGVEGFLGLMPGTILLSALLDVESHGLVYACAAVAFGGLLLALTAAHTRDHTRHGRPPARIPTRPASSWG